MSKYLEGLPLGSKNRDNFLKTMILFYYYFSINIDNLWFSHQCKTLEFHKTLDLSSLMEQDGRDQGREVTVTPC